MIGMEVLAVPSTNELLHETAGRLLLGELEVAELPQAHQYELLAFLREEKLVLMAADSRKAGLTSRLLFPNLRTPTLESELETERRRCDSQRSALLEAQAHLEEAGIPLLLFPELIMPILGWATLDPISTRVVGAALMGIGIESYLGRNASIEVFRSMLNLKVIWSSSAILGISLGLWLGGASAGWLFLVIFVIFWFVWMYYWRKPF